MSKCELRHTVADGICTVCGQVTDPQAHYRATKLKRGLRVQTYTNAGKPDRRFIGTTHLRCPECEWEVIVLGRPTRRGKMPTRWARCTRCGHAWKTASKEAFGGTRQVEVRG